MLIAPESYAIIEDSLKRQRGLQDAAVVEFKGLRKDGERRDAISFSVPIIYKGRPAVQGNLFDVTEQKRAEQRILELKDFSEAIIQSAPVAVHVVDRGFIVKSWNRYCEEYINVKNDEIVGENLFEVIPSLKELGWDRVYKQVMETEEPYYKKDYGIERTFGPRKGEVFYQDINVIPLRERGEVRYALTLLVDVTDKKRARDSLVNLIKELKEAKQKLEDANLKLQETDRLKSIFLASVSHELRTPLNSILGFTGIMLQGLVGDFEKEQKKQLEIVYFNAKHLSYLIEDLLDISSLESGGIDISPEKFKTHEVVEKVIASFSSEIDSKNLRIIREGESAEVFTDKKRFKQILINLLSNAVKFTQNGSITITTTVEDGNFEVSVKDTGIGIRKKDMSKLFTPFSHIDLPAGKIKEGTGLGLYLAQKIANYLGGGIIAESTFGKGTAFTLTLPDRYM